MAAAANKPGPVHYTLAIFVVLSVVLGITNYMSFKDAADRTIEVDKLTKDNQAAIAQIKNLDDDVQALKRLIGNTLTKVEDRANPQNPATVVAATTTELANYAKDLTGKDLLETIHKFRDQVDSLTADRDSKNARIASIEREMLALNSQYQGKVDSANGQAKAAERDKLEVIGTSDERINDKIRENTTLKNQANELLTQNTEAKDQYEKDIERREIANSSLQSRIETLRERLDNIEKLSFEVPKGLITFVDYANRRVLLNLGEADFLKPRITFSVYAKDNQGVARSVEDIKGKLEVTRILGPHLSQANITDEDMFRPIVAQDLIYTPIWSPGLQEKISVIGLVDLDNDGRSDREQFRQLLATAGCKIDVEIDDNGDRIPENGKVTVETRFLVKGICPDLSVALPDEDMEKARKIDAQLGELREEARTNGVRIIKLNDFLAYVGFHSNRRTFLPGQSQKFTLKSGNKGVVGSDSTDRTANGTVSGVYLNKSGKPKQDSNSTDNSESTPGNKKK